MRFATKREDPKQQEGAEEPRRQDARQGLDLGDLGTGVHVDDGAGKHAELADPIEGPRLHGREPHHQVDHEEGEDRHQAQGEEVEGPVLLHTGIDRPQAVGEAPLHRVAEDEPAGQKGEGGADGGGKGDDQGAPQEAEDGAARQRHDGRTGQ